MAEGDHYLDDLGDLQNCFNVVGIGRSDKIRLFLDSGYGFELVIQDPGSSIRLENVTITSKLGQAGLWVHNGAEVTLKDCVVRNMATGIKLSGEQTVGHFKWSEFLDCQIGVEVEDGARCDISGGLIEDCSVGIRLTGKTKHLEDSGVTIEDMDNYSVKHIDFVHAED